ncbi:MULTISPECIES: ABC transporter ATP-binding protein [Exiguobacterium]|uniref:ABC transporter ATP-binding protein n=1 Tax=Exiguobacterium TaxID=33986 RepID=UPI0008779D15|nr:MULTISPECIES: ABC transporter ATP-binding protein [Exiguobacterium]OGX80623.1 ABC transporter ATP-binding protein [Exiguobacterium sp. SH31]TCI35623.1 ABC transporter ATP-binding protein [Exiguobacterium sp. SH4S7]TCI43581.1 ABC transporter ATP-binding protein [Exiguobacterium sp. SH5S32]TCI52527.1 ABC transporter ATP-binding protein [Exiguobacterium sp. SH1S4]TCI65299.1 ABC transporter ATP-binding protein [Exiguobacterium sp. SH0S2]
MQPTLKIDHLTKVIGKKTIIDDISFDVFPGEVFGFLGPNGAGKTTTIRMIVGLIKPTKGSVSICGFGVERQFVQAMNQIGAIVENPELYKFLSGRENLNVFARMLPGITEARIQEVIDLVDLTARIDDKVKTYSLGMRQRLGIAQAMLNNPRVLILDEPTNGLDPMGIRDLRLFIRRLVEETGLSVLVSSHILAEIELLADRVAIMSRGKIVKVGTVQELINELASTVDVHVADSFEVLPIVRGFESIEQADVVDERTIRVSMNLEDTARLNRYLLDRDVEVFGLERRVQTLEELFITLTGGDHIV